MSDASNNEGKQGFLITPFGDELVPLCDLIREVGRESGVRMERADDIFRPGVIVDQILDAIDEADLIVAITTGRNPNVFFELGYAWRKHNPIILAETSDDLPFDVSAWRAILYGDGRAASDSQTIGESLRRAIVHVLEDGRPLPQGRRLSSPLVRKPEPRLTARLEPYGTKSHRMVIGNAGTIEMRNVDLEIPDDARSMHIRTEDLPIDVLRPGEQVSLLTLLMMGGGRSIFDVTVTGNTPEGETMRFPNKISL